MFRKKTKNAKRKTPKTRKGLGSPASFDVPLRATHGPGGMGISSAMLARHRSAQSRYDRALHEHRVKTERKRLEKDFDKLRQSGRREAPSGISRFASDRFIDGLSAISAPLARLQAGTVTRKTKHKPLIFQAEKPTSVVAKAKVKHTPRREEKKSHMPSMPRMRSTPEAKVSGALSSKRHPMSRGPPRQTHLKQGGTHSFQRVEHRGGSIVVVGQDRLAPVVLSTKIYYNSDINYPGSVIYQFQIQPGEFGERVRRLESTFENFKFLRLSVEYVGACSIDTPGTFMGCFDADAADYGSYGNGDTSLRAAMSHPGARVCKMWDNCTWHMDTSRKGDFYVGSSGDTSADRRQQAEGVFILMVETPTNAIADDVDFFVGTLYVRYEVELSKPGIIQNFVGTADLITWDFDGTTVITSDQNQPLIELLRGTITTHLDGIYPNFDKRSNAGSSFNVHGGIPSSIAIPSGCWNINLMITYSFTATSTANKCTIMFAGSPNSYTIPDIIPVVNDGQQGQFNSAVSIYSPHTGDHSCWSNSNTLAGALRRRNLGTRVLVPSGQFLYFTPYFVQTTAGGVTISITNMALSIASSWPTDEEAVYLAPTESSLTSRIKALEDAKISSDPTGDGKTADEGKEEKTRAQETKDSKDSKETKSGPAEETPPESPVLVPQVPSASRRAFSIFTHDMPKKASSVKSSREKPQ